MIKRVWRGTATGERPPDRFDRRHLARPAAQASARGTRLGHRPFERGDGPPRADPRARRPWPRARCRAARGRSGWPGWRRRDVVQRQGDRQHHGADGEDLTRPHGRRHDDDRQQERREQQCRRVAAAHLDGRSRESRRAMSSSAERCRRPEPEQRLPADIHERRREDRYGIPARDHLDEEGREDDGQREQGVRISPASRLRPRRDGVRSQSKRITAGLCATRTTVDRTMGVDGMHRPFPVAWLRRIVRAPETGASRWSRRPRRRSAGCRATRSPRWARSP